MGTLKSLKSAIVIFSLLLPISAYTAKDQGRAHASWWIRNYGVVPASENPLVKRAEAVFSRVTAAADKKGNRVPRLLVIPGGGQPYALALQDGTVLLTEKGLRICYENAKEENGDSRLAFLLGHELAHLAKDDFWHLFAFTAIQNYGKDEKVSRSVADLIKSTTDMDPLAPRSLEVARMKELQADSYGIIYMAMAGYDPSAVLDENGSNFFTYWTSQITSQTAFIDSTHPSPEERAEMVRSQLAAVRQDTDLFHFGVRLYQLGRYEDAILFLQKYLEKFPSREVYNNLGLCHYQIAFRNLTSCNPLQAFRFKLATLIDPDTIVRGLNRAGEVRTPEECKTKPEFADRIVLAANHFETAASLDPLYAPARLNLSSSWILAATPAKALGVLDELLKLDPGNSAAKNNKAVALYAYGIETGIDTVDQALILLESDIDKNTDASAYYNLAAIQSERGRNAAAKENWEKFLVHDSSTGFNEYVRKKLGPEQGYPQKDKVGESAVYRIQSPFPLGPMNQKGLKLLKDMEVLDVQIGTFHGQIRTSNTASLLIIEDTVEIVEVKQNPPITLAELRNNCGEPLKVLQTPGGSTHVYHTFAADISQDLVRVITYFEE